MYVRSENWEPPQRAFSFEAEVRTMHDVVKRLPGLNASSAMEILWVGSLPLVFHGISRNILEVYTDIIAGRHRMRVFRSMERVDRERQQSAERHEQELEMATELTERYVEWVSSPMRTRHLYLSNPGEKA